MLKIAALKAIVAVSLVGAATSAVFYVRYLRSENARMASVAASERSQVQAYAEASKTLNARVKSILAARNAADAALHSNMSAIDKVKSNCLDQTLPAGLIGN